MYRKWITTITICLTFFYLSTFTYSNNTSNNILLFDKDLSASSGTTIISSVYDVSFKFKHFIPKDLLPDTDFFNTITHITSIFLWDIPLSLYFKTWNHEFFGHAHRYREYGHEELYYAVYWPWPYKFINPKRGGGYAGYKISTKKTLNSFHDTTMLLSGSESNQLLGRFLFIDQFKSGKVSYPNIGLSFIANLDFSSYILKMTEDDLNYNHWDPIRYLHTINRIYMDQSNWTEHDSIKYKETPHSFYKLTLTDLKNAAYLNIFSPMSLVGFFGCSNYLLSGVSENNFPYFNLGELRYFPDLRAHLTPFGLSYEFSLYTLLNNTFSSWSITTNDGKFSPFWGVSASVSPFLTIGELAISTELELWSQPSITENTPYKLKSGGLIAFNLSYPSFLFKNASLLANLGYKTEGYSPKYQLSEGYLFQYGFSLGFK